MAASQVYVQLPFGFVSPAEVIAAGVVLPVLGIIVVALRFHARRIQKAHVGIDDWLTVPASVSFS